MAGCEARWFTIDEIQELARTSALIPEEFALFERALVLFRLWAADA